MSNSSIMSVRELIDSAFGEDDGNVVNFKLMQTILYLLARQLRVLGRHVEVDLDPALGVTSRTTINVSELKMQTAVPKKKKKAKLVAPRTSDADSEQQTTDQPNKEKKHPAGKPSKKEAEQEKDYTKLMENIEEQREKELRVIRQRANSREEAEKSPTPMASMDSMEMQYEKLLVVERLPSGEVKPEDDQKTDGKTRQLSVVTQQQFQALAETVRELQDRFGGIASADFPDNIKLMQELRKGASLTDSMAALQMSARLDAAEKTLKKMLSLVTDLVSQDQIESKTTGPDKKAQTGSKRISKTGKQHPTSPKAMGKEKLTLQNTITEEDATQVEKDDVKKSEYITSMELDRAIQALQADILKEVTTMTTDNTESAKNALKIAKRLEKKLEGTTHLESRMKDLELLVADYADEINTLDSSLSAQMTNYQEQLTQMQHDLEVGLENMAEALANAGGDTAVMAELNTNFSYLQEDFDRTVMKQKELQEVQSSFHLDLKTLWEHIEKLREIKPDREEITDALRDKADLKSLNGLVTQEHFDAVRGNFEKSIGAAYDKFNHQELVWQKAIDDIFRELNEKIEWSQLHFLRDDVNKNLEMLNRRIHAMVEILGEPRAAATTRKLFRDSTCLSCASPANMDMTQGDTLPVMPALPQSSTNDKTITNETSKPKEDGDHNICYPGRPIKHPIDPRAQYCRRYCGGGILSRPTLKYVPKTPSLHISTGGIGSDGKTYLVEEHEQPCIPCNIDNRMIAEPLEADQAPQPSEVEKFETTDYVSEDPGYCRCKENQDSVPLTPTFPMDDD